MDFAIQIRLGIGEYVGWVRIPRTHQTRHWYRMNALEKVWRLGMVRMHFIRVK